MLSGYGESARRVDGVLKLVEYVRTEHGFVYSRIKNEKWIKESHQNVNEAYYKGMKWCVHKKGLEIKTKLVRLPA